MTTTLTPPTSGPALGPPTPSSGSPAASATGSAASAPASSSTASSTASTTSTPAATSPDPATEPEKKGKWYKPWTWSRKKDKEPKAETEKDPIERMLKMFVYTIAVCTVIGGLLGWWSYTHPLFGSIWAGISIGFGTGAVLVGLKCLRMEYRARSEAAQAVLVAAASAPPTP